LGMGHCAQYPNPNPQSLIPNPQSNNKKIFNKENYHFFIYFFK